MVRAIVFVVWLAALTAVASAQSSSTAPALALKDVRGRRLRLSDYKGDVVLINFWATWCPPSQSEIPDLIKMQRHYRNQGLRIIGITYPPQKVSEVQRFARALKINYRVAIGTEDTKDLFTSSQTLPMTVVVDRNGSVREVIEGVMYPDEFDQKVKPLLVQHSARAGS